MHYQQLQLHQRLQAKRRRDLRGFRFSVTDLLRQKEKLEETRCSEHLNSLINDARRNGITLQSLNLALTDDELAHTVSRRFFSTHVGGSSQGGRIRTRSGALGKHAQSKYIMFAWRQPWNPYMPLRPGDPGLFFDGSPGLDDDVPDGIRYTFVRLDHNKWLYLGNYKYRNVARLSVDEWRLQAEKVRMVLIHNPHASTRTCLCNAV